MATQFDFSAVQVEDATLPKGERAKRIGPNPFTEVVAQSYESKTGKQVSVPAGDAVKQATAFLRRAADDLGCGVRIVYRNSKGQTLKYDAAKDSKSKGNVTILFQGKDRKQRKAKDEAPASEG